MRCEICNKEKSIDTLYYQYAVCPGCWVRHIKGEININELIDINKFRYIGGNNNRNFNIDTLHKIRELRKW